MLTFRVVLAGRVNVGKSTLFNALTGKRKALYDKMEGVTRDVLEEEVEWRGKTFLLCDCAGKAADDLYLEGTPEKEIREKVKVKLAETYSRASLFVLVLDAKSGLLPEDEELFLELKKYGKPLIVAVNKVDIPEQEASRADFYRLGLSHLFLISATAKRGLGDLLDAIISYLPDERPEVVAEEVKNEIRIALVGRPNVGKSTLLNAFLGEERAIVTAVPGTTRDIVEATFFRDGKRYVMADTAGIKRKKTVRALLEYAALRRAFQIVQQSHAIFFLLDGAEGILKQDKKIAEWMEEAQKPYLFVLNKWDLVPNKREAKEAWGSAIERSFPSFCHAPIAFVSAKERKGLSLLLRTLSHVLGEYTKRVPTGKLNNAFQSVLKQASPPYPVKLYYISQVEAAPPRFVIFGKNTNMCRQNFLRFLERQLRQSFGFAGCPIVLELREVKKSKGTLRLKEAAQSRRCRL